MLFRAKAFEIFIYFFANVDHFFSHQVDTDNVRFQKFYEKSTVNGRIAFINGPILFALHDLNGT